MGIISQRLSQMPNLRKLKFDQLWTTMNTYSSMSSRTAGIRMTTRPFGKAAFQHTPEEVKSDEERKPTWSHVLNESTTLR